MFSLFRNIFIILQSLQVFYSLSYYALRQYYKHDTSQPFSTSMDDVPSGSDVLQNTGTANNVVHDPSLIPCIEVSSRVVRTEEHAHGMAILYISDYLF